MSKSQSRKVDLPKLSLRAAVEPASIDKENRRVELVWTTGSKGLRSSWLDGPWYEELSLDPAHVRMERLTSGSAPLLNSHGSWSMNLDDVIGVVEKAWLDKGQGRAIVRFSDRAEVEGIWRDVANGILKNISVGYRVYTYERQADTVDPDGEEEPATYLAIDWEPQEISVVPIGFDKDATIRAEETRGAPCEFINKIQPNTKRAEEEREMDVNTKTEGQTPAPAAAPVVDNSEAIKAERAAERARQSEIRTLVRTHKLGDELADKLCGSDTTVDQARAQVLAELAKRDAATQTTGHHRVETGAQDEVETRNAAMTAAILHRSAPATHKLEGAAREFSGMSLLRMAEEIIGRRARGMSKSELARSALTTSDFANVLANVGRKSLRDGYGLAVQTFWGFVNKGTLPDYKNMSRVTFGDAPSLDVVNEKGEYKSGSIGDSAEQIKLSRYGKLIVITEETIVNDDLDALSRLPQRMGAAASRLESKLVYDILMNNPTMSDTVAIFHANHGNLAGAGTTIPNGLAAARAALRKQMTLDKTDYLGLTAKALICGPDKEVEALQNLAGQMLATKAGDVNVFRGTMDVIVDPRVTGNAWFIAADPAQIDTIEVSYLEGETGPMFASEKDFNSDGVKFKIKHVVGVKCIDYKGLYKNPGA